MYFEKIGDPAALELLADVIALANECALFIGMTWMELDEQIDAKAARFQERMQQHEQEKKP